MTDINISAKCAGPGARAASNCGVAAHNSGFLPAHIFARIFVSAFAAVLAVHFWKHGAK